MLSCTIVIVRSKANGLFFFPPSLKLTNKFQKDNSQGHLCLSATMPIDLNQATSWVSFEIRSHYGWPQLEIMCEDYTQLSLLVAGVRVEICYVNLPYIFT